MDTQKKKSTSESVYRTLREQILYLELPPGSAISEIETAAQYKISRTPIRDVFKRLQLEGLLEIRPHIGTFVSLIDLNMISDIFYMREVVEQAIIRDLTVFHDKSWEFRIRLVLQKQKELLDSDISIEELSRKFIKLDNEFHNILYSMAGKENVMTLFGIINSQYERFRTFVNLSGKENIKVLYEDHVQIWECILTNQKEHLPEYISNHIYNGFTSSTELISKYPEYFF